MVARPEAKTAPLSTLDSEDDEELAEAEPLPVTNEAEPTVIGKRRTQNKQPVVDVNPNLIDEGEIEGADIAPPLEEDDDQLNESNSVEIRGVRYALPRVGPLFYIAINRIMERQKVAWEKVADLEKRGYTPDRARSKAGTGQPASEYMELMWDIGQQSIPRDILVTLTMDELRELQSQLRPFDEGGPAPSS